MSPEQVRGENADHRSDIFSFGAILHEMLTGQRAFRRPTMAETMTAILKEEPPDILESNSKVPPQLERLVRRCLEKRPERRFHSAHDLGFALEALSTPSSATFASAEIPRTPARWSQREWWLSMVAVACLLGLFASLPLAVSHLRESAIDARPLKFSVLLPQRSRIGGTAVPMALSPDGQRLAFTVTRDGVSSIWLRSLDSLNAQPLAGTEGAYASLFWSPDSRSIGFFTVSRLKKIAISGGPVQTLCDVEEARGGAWNRAGVILFAANSGPLMRIPASGGTPVAVTTLNKALGEETQRWPAFLPDGRHFIYFARTTQPEQTGIYASSLDGMEPKRLLVTSTSAVYAAPGFLLFLQTQANKELGVAPLLAQPFDAAKLDAKGDPTAVGEQVGYNLGLGRAFLAASEQGTLAFYNVSYGANLPIWFDRSGKLIEKLDALGTAGTYFTSALSGNGKRVALDRVNPETGATDIWVVDLASHIPMRLTTHGSYNRFPVWSPDSNRIVFASSRDGAYALYVTDANATGDEQLLFKSDRPIQPTDWSPDGKFVVYEDTGEKTKRDVWLLPLTGEAKPIPLLGSEFNEQNAHFSPDGKWIAYCSDESGTPAIYVQPFPATGAKIRISADGARQPRWRKDGKELFYVSGTTLMAVPINSGAEFQAGSPHAIFEEKILDYFGNVRAGYTVSADGQRFLSLPVVDETGSTPISVAVNWTSEPKK
jgi:Tol biopolymer transport system component